MRGLDAITRFRSLFPMGSTPGIYITPRNSAASNERVAHAEVKVESGGGVPAQMEIARGWIGSCSAGRRVGRHAPPPGSLSFGVVSFALQEFQDSRARECGTALRDFRLTNSPQFANPPGSLTSSTFGYMTRTLSSGTGVVGTGGRVVQLGAKVSF
jgi:hypothetical protein